MSIHRIATIAAAAVLALAGTAAPVLAAGSPLTHFTYAATGLNDEGSLCGYTFTSGMVTIVFRSADAYPGQTGAAHIRLENVWAAKDQASFRVVGTESYTDLGGRLTIKLFFVASDQGLADSVNVIFRTWADGSWHIGFERDSCHLYG